MWLSAHVTSTDATDAALSYSEISPLNITPYDRVTSLACAFSISITAITISGDISDQLRPTPCVDYCKINH